MTTTRQRFRRALILIMFLLFPLIINYLSPYLIIAGTVQGVIAGSFILFTLLFLFSLFFGRAFCGWVCPGAGLQESLFPAQSKKAPGGRANWIKYFIWVPWISLIIYLAVVAGGYRAINPLFMMESGISITEPRDFITYFGVVSVITIPSLAVGKRAFCHYICWMAPFMIIGTRLKDALHLPSLHMKADPDKCKSCRTCDTVCPMSLEVQALAKSGIIRNDECILCGSCADNCPHGVIGYAFLHRRDKSTVKS